jgi:cytochrome b561
MNYTQIWNTLKNYAHIFLSFLDQHPYVFIGLLVLLFVSWSCICWKLFRHAPTKAEKKKIVQWFLNGIIILLSVSFILLLLVMGVGQGV